MAPSQRGDMTNYLSDDILISILDRIPIKEQVATRVLSRRWRNLWSLNPDRLDLGSGDGDSVPSELVPWFLDHWGDRNLHKLRACINPSMIDRFLSFAADRSVRDLSITCLPWSYHNSIPREFFAGPYLTLLTSLTLRYIDIGMPYFLPTEFTGFSSLRYLHIENIFMSNHELVSLLSLSPLLESLTLCISHSLSTIVLDSSSRITELKVMNCGDLRRIDAVGSRLQKFTCDNTLVVLYDVLTLEEASFMSYYLHLQMESASHVTVLHLDKHFFHSWHSCSPLAFFRASKESIFNLLRDLHLDLDRLTYLVLLSLAVFLKHCPFMKKLYIKMSKGSFQISDDGSLYDESICDVPEWKRKLAFHALSDRPLNYLKVVELRNWVNTPSQLDLAKYILDKGIVLQSLHVAAYRDRDLDQKEIIEKELALFARSSSTARVVVSEEPED